MYADLPRSFMENCLFRYSFTPSKFFLSFPISNMSSAYNTRNARAPTLLLIDAELFDVLDESKRFDDLIKSKVPAPRRLLQPIDGPLKLAHLTSIPWIDKPLWLYHIQLFLNVAIKECSFHIHLPYLVIMICSYC